MNNRLAKISLVAIAIVVIAILVVWKIPEWQVPDNLPEDKAAELENEFRKTTAQIEAGIGIFFGLFFTGIGVYYAGQRARAMENAVSVSSEGQITERFTRAIDQIGSDKVAIRLGGIYALERIAKDSPDKDHWQVMEVLSAYVRENSRWSAVIEKTEEQDLGSWIQSQNAPENQNDRLAEEWRLEKETPKVDVQAILTILGRRNRAFETELQRLDLANTDLRRYSISGNLDGVRLDKCNLRRAELDQISLKNALMRDALIDDAFVRDADLSESSLDGASIARSLLAGSDLRGTELGRVNFSDCILSGADLRAANLENTVLVGANLCGADLRDCTWITQEQIDSAQTDVGTQLPDGLNAAQR